MNVSPKKGHEKLFCREDRSQKAWNEVGNFRELGGFKCPNHIPSGEGGGEVWIFSGTKHHQKGPLLTL